MIQKYFFIYALIWLFSCTNKGNDGYRSNGESLSGNDGFYDHTISDSAAIADEYTSNSNFDKLVQKYEDPQRLNWQNPELVIEKLGHLGGKTVADIGAGSGYFTFRMAETAEEIIAIDIDPRFLEYIEERKHEIPASQAKKIKTRLTRDDDPSLESNEVDIALVVNTYHYIKNRDEYFKKVKNGLKEDGFLVIVDFKNSANPIAPPEEMIVAPEIAFQELREAGFREFSIDVKSLQYQYILIAH